jgi:hypothetical protein
MKKINLNEWVKMFDNGDFNNPDFKTQCDAGWYDWFCSQSSLLNKTKKLGKYLKLIINSPKLSPEKQYVWFKNNCPMDGSLYDDFRIADIESGNTIFTIVPMSGHKSENGKGSVWGKSNNFNGPLFEGSWKEIKKWFLEETV